VVSPVHGHITDVGESGQSRPQSYNWCWWKQWVWQRGSCVNKCERKCHLKYLFSCFNWITVVIHKLSFHVQTIDGKSSYIHLSPLLSTFPFYHLLITWDVFLFPSHLRLHRLCVAHSLLCTGYRDYFPGLRRPEHQVDHSPPPETEVKSEWSYTSTPPIRLHGVKKDTFFF